MTEPTDALAEAWTALRASWSDSTRHDAFIALAQTLGRLPDAAARYQSVASDPELAPACERARKLVVALALAQIEATPRTGADTAKNLGRWLIPITLLGTVLSSSFVAARATHNHVFASIPVLALEIAVVALLPWGRLLR